MTDSDSGPWITVPMENGVHVLPLQELARHELDRGCWCGAWADRWDPVSGEPYWREVVGHTVIGDGLEGRGVGPVQRSVQA